MSGSQKVVYEALKKLSDDRVEGGERRSYSLYVIVVLGLFIAALALQLLSNFLDYKLIPYGVLFFLALVYLALVSFPFVVAWRNRNEVKRLFSNPLSVIIDGVSQESVKSLKFIDEANKVNLPTLKYVLINIRAEKEAFEKRINLVIGKIDRIGIIFGLLAFFITMNQTMGLSKDTSSSVSEWALAISFGVPVLYMFGLWGNILVSKMDYMVKLLEFLIDTKESKKKITIRNF